jgi:hypothetical protein
MAADCVIGDNKLLTRSFFTSSKILNGAYFCGNNNIADCVNISIPNNLRPFEDEIFYNDTIWFSFACQKDIDTIYCFDVPSGGLSMFRYIGVTQNLANTNENEHVSLSQALRTILSRYRKRVLVYSVPNNLFANKSFNERELFNTNHTIMKFDEKRGKVIYNNIRYIPKGCIPCLGDNEMKYRDNIILLMELIYRKLHRYFKKRGLLNEKDILLLNLYHRDNKLVFFRFGFPEHNLINTSLDELISYTCSTKNRFI